MPPPAMEADHPYYEAIVKDPRYAAEDGPEEFPMFESLKLTIERTLPYWNEVVVPQVKAGKSVLIAAHGNSLRGVVKHLDGISDQDIMALNLPTGTLVSQWLTQYLCSLLPQKSQKNVCPKVFADAPE